MSDLTILTVTNDHKFLELFRRQLHDQVTAGSLIMVAATIDEACSRLKMVRPRLIVVHWTRDSKSYEQLDRLLWTTTVQARQIPVLVIAERYRTDQATTMYRMGVSEYISRSHHLDHLGPIFSAYLPVIPVVSSAETAEAVASSEHTSNTWSLNHKATTITTQAV
jgi:DNA-binding NarL/FixJ family response regulator